MNKEQTFFEYLLQWYMRELQFVCLKNNLSLIYSSPVELVFQVLPENKEQLFSLCNMIRFMELNASGKFSKLCNLFFGCDGFNHFFLTIEMANIEVLKFIVNSLKNSIVFSKQYADYETILKLMQDLEIYSVGVNCFLDKTDYYSYLFLTNDSLDELPDIFDDRKLLPNYHENATCYYQGVELSSDKFLLFKDFYSLEKYLKQLENHLSLTLKN